MVDAGTATITVSLDTTSIVQQLRDLADMIEAANTARPSEGA